MLSDNDSTKTDLREQELANLIAQVADRMQRGEEITLEQISIENPEFADDVREVWGMINVTETVGRHKKETPEPADSFVPILDLPYRFGDFMLEKIIGRGGMGVVYQARQISLGRDVALKMILKGDAASESDRRRFQAEAEAASRLTHPNIVPINEVGQEMGRSFIAMRLITGDNLAEVLARGPMNPREAARLMVDVAKAIHYAHENGVLHRDLKPSNILLGKSGLPYVADFGLAKNIGESQSLTGSGDLLGTPAYMSPEQATGRGKSGRAQIGVASDIYSLGAILYHMVTGRPPFQASTPVDTILMVIEQDTISPRMLNRRVDRDLEMIVMKCLQKPQDLRYESADELAEDLQAFLRNEPVRARQGRFGQVIGSWFRETHHAIVLENWGLLWMWHSAALLVACLATNILQWTITDKNVWWPYVLLWTVGFGAWAIVFWLVRRSMGPVTFVERQVAHVWAASFFCVVALFPLERMLQLAPLTLSPVLALIAGMTFLIKAGILSGVFYIAAAAMLITF